MVKITTFCRTLWFGVYLFITLEWCIKYEQTIHDRLLSYNFKYHQFAHKPNISVSIISQRCPACHFRDPDGMGLHRGMHPKAPRLPFPKHYEPVVWKGRLARGLLHHG